MAVFPAILPIFTRFRPLRRFVTRGIPSRNSDNSGQGSTLRRGYPDLGSLSEPRVLFLHPSTPCCSTPMTEVDHVVTGVPGVCIGRTTRARYPTLGTSSCTPAGYPAQTSSCTPAGYPAQTPPPYTSWLPCPDSLLHPAQTASCYPDKTP